MRTPRPFHACFVTRTHHNMRPHFTICRRCRVLLVCPVHLLLQGRRPAQEPEELPRLRGQDGALLLLRLGTGWCYVLVVEEEGVRGVQRSIARAVRDSPTHVHPLATQRNFSKWLMKAPVKIGKWLADKFPC